MTPEELDRLEELATLRPPPYITLANEVPALIAEIRRLREGGELGTPLQAIEFAIIQSVEADTFLRSWSEGDISEWPDYAEFITARQALNGEKK